MFIRLDLDRPLATAIARPQFFMAVRSITSSPTLLGGAVFLSLGFFLGQSACLGFPDGFTYFQDRGRAVHRDALVIRPVLMPARWASVMAPAIVSAAAFLSIIDQLAMRRIFAAMLASASFAYSSRTLEGRERRTVCRRSGTLSSSKSMSLIFLVLKFGGLRFGHPGVILAFEGWLGEVGSAATFPRGAVFLHWPCFSPPPKRLRREVVQRLSNRCRLQAHCRALAERITGGRTPKPQNPKTPKPLKINNEFQYNK